MSFMQLCRSFLQFLQSCWVAGTSGREASEREKIPLYTNATQKVRSVNRKMKSECFGGHAILARRRRVALKQKAEEE